MTTAREKLISDTVAGSWKMCVKEAYVAAEEKHRKRYGRQGFESFEEFWRHCYHYFPAKQNPEKPWAK